MVFKFKSLSIAALSLSFALNSARVLSIEVTPPPSSELGTSIGVVQVADVGEITLGYTGDVQNLINIGDYYNGKGTVKYRLGETGTFSETVPTAVKEGKYDVYYYIFGDPNYNNYDKNKNSADEEARISASPSHLVVNIVKKESSDQSSDISGSSTSNVPINISYSVSTDGTTSAVVDRYGFVWVKEESDGTSAWYGLDNTSGVFEIGSRFHVKWLKEGDTDYEKYFKQLDDVYKKKAETNNIEIFLVGVTKPDGKTEYENFYKETGKTAGLYVQLGDDWDANDVNALFVTENDDKPIEVQYGSVSKFSSIYKDEGIVFPETGSSYARLTLTHFSPYAIVGAKKSTSSSSGSASGSSSKLSSYYNALSTKTGEDYSSILYLSLMSSISLMYVLISRKRKIRN